MAPVRKFGVKAKKGKKGGKKGKKNGARQFTAPLNAPQTPTQPAAYMQEEFHDGKKGSTSTCVLAWLIVISYVAAIILGVLVTVGCTTSKTGLGNIYIAEISANETYDFSLRVGYFGGCVSIDQPDSLSSNTNDSNIFTYCIGSMRDHDLDDLSEELWETLDPSPAREYLQNALNTTLPYVYHLQNDVFYWQPPVLHAVCFFFSGALLFVACTGISHKKAYKGVLFGIMVFAVFAFGLSLVTVLASLQALNALLNGSSSTEEIQLDIDFYLSRGDMMHALQAATVAVAAVFYVLMGMLFVRRTPSVSIVLNFFQRAGNGLREKVRR